MSEANPSPTPRTPMEALVGMAATMEVTTTFNAAGEVVRAGLPAIDNALEVGDVVAERYEIRKLLGHGGCGYVYAVYDRELEVDVALKTLRPDIRMAPEHVAQLKREIQLARKVTHANVCRIFDVGFHADETGSTPFFTMEEIDGESLGDRLARDGPLSTGELGPLALQLVAGLEAAHGAGVVHADLKPANIMVTGAGDELRAVITDFGLATAAAIDLSHENYVLGTPAYMAPEQVESKPLSPATDCYALGCTLYHAATGRVPFREKTAFATATARLERDPEPPGIDRKWDQLITGLLRRAPADRLTGADVAAVLDPPRRWRLIAAIAAAVAVVAVIAAVILASRVDDGGPKPFELSLPENPEAAELVVEAERLIAIGSFAAADQAVDRAVELAPDHPRAYAARAFANRGLRTGRSRNAALRAFELASSVPESEQRYYQAVSLTMTGKQAEARSVLNKLAVHHPGSFELELLLADSFARAGEHEMARRSLDKIEARTELEELSVLRVRTDNEVTDRKFTTALKLAHELDARSKAAGHTLLRSQALVMASLCERQLGELDDADRSGRTALALAREADDPWQIAEAESTLIALFMSREQYDAALEHLEGRRVALVRLGLDRSVAKLGVTRAEILADTGRTDEALAVLDDRTIPWLRRNRDVYWEGYALLVRAQIRRSRAELDRAKSDCRAGHAIFRGIENERLAAFALAVCAEALIETGDHREAAIALDESVAIREKIGLDFLVAQSRVSRAELALSRGDPERGYSEATAAAEFFAGRRMGNDEALAREVAARAALRSGDTERAAKQIALATARRQGEGVQLAAAIAITAQMIAEKPDPAAIAEQVARLEAGGYTLMAIDGERAAGGGAEEGGQAPRRRRGRGRGARRGQAARLEPVSLRAAGRRLSRCSRFASRGPIGPSCPPAPSFPSRSSPWRSPAANPTTATTGPPGGHPPTGGLLRCRGADQRDRDSAQTAGAMALTVSDQSPLFAMTSDGLKAALAPILPTTRTPPTGCRGCRTSRSRRSATCSSPSSTRSSTAPRTTTVATSPTTRTPGLRRRPTPVSCLSLTRRSTSSPRPTSPTRPASPA